MMIVYTAEQDRLLLGSDMVQTTWVGKPSIISMVVAYHEIHDAPYITQGIPANKPNQNLLEFHSPKLMRH